MVAQTTVRRNPPGNLSCVHVGVVNNILSKSIRKIRRYRQYNSCYVQCYVPTLNIAYWSLIRTFCEKLDAFKVMQCVTYLKLVGRISLSVYNIITIFTSVFIHCWFYCYYYYHSYFINRCIRIVETSLSHVVIKGAEVKNRLVYI
jgi:hypothetical protein